MEKKYYKRLDIIRVIACLAVLFYHLDLLKGGYLAVCTFFVLSGFLSCVSAFKKDKFNFLEYYKSRLTKIYIPLVIVVFLSITLISFVPNATGWINLKTETTSVLLGYNNFWQIGANLDYFARSANSPFTHFWYISILMQFELIFPFFFLLMKKIGKRFSEVIPTIITIALSVISFIFFYNLNTGGNFNSSYYDTFARSFSLLIGVSLGFIYHYYKTVIDEHMNDKAMNKRMFYSFLLVLLCLFISIDSSFYYFPLIMLVVSLITCYLILYGVQKVCLDNNFSTRGIKYLSSLSYLIYLVQYPIIYIFQFFNFNSCVNIVLVLLTIFIISCIINVVLDKSGEVKLKKNIFKIILIVLLSMAVSYGVYLFVTASSYMKDMKELESELAAREQEILKNQEEYEKNIQDELNKHISSLEEIEASKANLDEAVKNLPIVGVGDSIMLGAVPNMQSTFKNGYFDAKVSRSIWSASDILNDLRSKKMLKGPVVINLGANGDCSKACKVKIIESIGDNEIFWFTVTNDKSVHVNDKLRELANTYSNVHIIDWESISQSHTEYFYKDGIHLTGSGRKAYTDALFNAIKEVYGEVFEREKEKLINEYKEQEKSKITFFGNDLLLYSFNNVNNVFTSSLFNIDKDYKYNSLLSKIKSLVSDDTLTSRVVLAFDSNVNLSTSDYRTLIDECGDRQVYVVSTSQKLTTYLNELNKDNVHVIDFIAEINSHSDYLLKDKIHLSDEGNKALANMLVDELLSVN